jgi:hypothetical protein
MSPTQTVVIYFSHSSSQLFKSCRITWKNPLTLCINTVHFKKVQLDFLETGIKMMRLPAGVNIPWRLMYEYDHWSYYLLKSGHIQDSCWRTAHLVWRRLAWGTTAASATTLAYSAFIISQLSYLQSKTRWSRFGIRKILFRSDIFRIENPSVWQIPVFSQIFYLREIWQDFEQNVCKKIVYCCLNIP